MVKKNCYISYNTKHAIVLAIQNKIFECRISNSVKQVSSTSRAIKSRILMIQNLTKPKLKILVARLLGFHFSRSL